MSRFALTTPIEVGTIDETEVNAALDAFATAINDVAGGGADLDAENIPPASIPPYALEAPNGIFCFPVALEYEEVTFAGSDFAGQGSPGSAVTYFVGVLPQAARLVGWSALVSSIVGLGGNTTPSLSLRADGVEIASANLVDGVVFSDGTLSTNVVRNAVLTLRVTNDAAASSHFVSGRVYVLFVAEGW